MTSALSHRGPDGSAVVDLPGAVFGHTRLAVIDLAESAAQPMHDVSGRYVMVYNGELYNFHELRSELDYPFRTQGDSEVVLAAFIEWGEACLHRFNGMFAFAIWDTQTRRLFVARDRLGEKPFFWSRCDGGFAFASEPQVLTLLPEVGRCVDAGGVAMYLGLNYTTGEQTVYAGIHRLPAGHCGWFDGEFEHFSYWDLAEHFRNKRFDLNLMDAALELQELLDESVRIRLVSDVPLGAFLSGGLDSSAITASMARHAGPQNSRTFSIGFDTGSFDELDYAAEVADHLQVDHTTATLHADRSVLARSLAQAAREPLADSSFLPMLLLAGMTRKHVTVALSGDGADEILLGYPTHLADRLHRWCAPCLRPFQPALSKLVERLPVSLDKVSFDYKARQWVGGLNLDRPSAHCLWRQIFNDNEIERLTGSRPVGNTPALAHFDKVRDLHYLDQASYVDIKTWLADDILTKVDRATMAHGLEARAPFLDHRLVEFAASLPIGFKLKGLQGKRLLRLSQRSRLPTRTLQRAKQGFNAPVSQWYNADLSDQMLDTFATASFTRAIDRTAVTHLVDEHRSGRRDNGLKLMSLHTLGLWMNA